MRDIIVGVLMIVASYLAIMERPPIPADIPFEYDSNMVTSDILAWCVAEPNVSFACTVAAHNKWGLRTELSVMDCYDPSVLILVQRSEKLKDADGGWNQYWNVIITPEAEGVHYIELACIDAVRRSDKRMLLVLCVEDDSPFLFMESPPTISMKQAQRAWQYAKKAEYPVTAPMVRR
jgi:hypothetical protein